MKDSFIIEGKKYISSRRASEISDYASDYIGQLCRAGKLDCKMVGRAWFITEESLSLHKTNVLQDEVVRNRIENLRGKKNRNLVVSSEAIKTSASTQTQTSTNVVTVTNSSIVVSSNPVISNQQAPVVSGSTPAQSKVSGSSFVYTSDERPLLPVLKKPVTPVANVSKNKKILSFLSKNESKSAVTKNRSASEIAGKVTKSLKKLTTVGKPIISYPELTRSIILRRALASALVIMFFIGMGTMTFNIFNSEEVSVATNASSSPSVASGSARANVYDVIMVATSFVKNGFGNIASLFTKTSKLTLNDTSPPDGFGGSQGLSPNGLAVTSSSGSDSVDEAVKQKIKGSFSDEVEVSPDESGTAGVITPVFRESKGKDFIYVMVPVDGKGASVTP
ncbi:MAG: hypothetical protein WCS89_03350 [Candidatus Paceibacterota bacterium]|jgi:hypothetical protein